MKEFNIEKLPRENVFKEPTVSFEQMQNKVMKNILPLPKKRSLSSSWIYSAAAAIALIMAFSIYINTNPNPNDDVQQLVVSSSPVDTSATITFPDNKQEIVAVKTQNFSEPDLTLPEPTHQKVEATAPREVQTSNVQVVASTDKQKPKTVEQPMDQILASFTSAELADVVKSSEQDIYLDLYN